MKHYKICQLNGAGRDGWTIHVSEDGVNYELISPVINYPTEADAQAAANSFNEASAQDELNK
jgi:hypothetical protein